MNIFQLDILMPLIRILDIYIVLKHELSPDEFCMLLFGKEEKKEICQLDLDPNNHYFNHVEDFKVKFMHFLNNYNYDWNFDIKCFYNG